MDMNEFVGDDVENIEEDGLNGTVQDDQNANDEAEIEENIPNSEENGEEIGYDTVNHPAHYGSGENECINIMIQTQGIEAVGAFCICNAFKYLYRHRYKGQIEDIKKCVWYLNTFLELCEGGER